MSNKSNRKLIEETAVNWLVFNLIKESDSDNSKAEIVKAIRDWTNLAKTLPELIEKKKQEIINSAKSLKKTIEQEYTVKNKLTTNYKKHKRELESRNRTLMKRS